MTEGQRQESGARAAGWRRWSGRGPVLGLVLVATMGCCGTAATGSGPGAGAARAPRSGGAEGDVDVGRAGRGGPTAMGLGWLAGSWRTGDGRAVEHWTAIGRVLVGVGFGGDGGKTRSFEVMVIHADGKRLVFTARPNGSEAVAFREEARDGRSISFANPAHDDPKRVAYRERDGVLVASTEGPGGRQEWRLERTKPAAVSGIQEAAAARGDRAVEIWSASPAGDAGFSIGYDEGDRARVTVWRQDAATEPWAAVFELRL